VSDIIFLEQIERESLQLGPVQLDEIAQLALQGCEVTAAAAGIRLRLEVEPDPSAGSGQALSAISADRDRLNQVFDNLLANAIKFSPSGGVITVRVHREMDAIGQRGGLGIGIPRDRLHQCSSASTRVDGSATRRFGGAGSALAIVKRIVEAHGGASGWKEPGQGTTFYCTSFQPPAGANGQPAMSGFDARRRGRTAVSDLCQAFQPAKSGSASPSRRITGSDARRDRQSTA
jgi:signal transduction histidine kinase